MDRSLALLRCLFEFYQRFMYCREAVGRTLSLSTQLCKRFSALIKCILRTAKEVAFSLYMLLREGATLVVNAKEVLHAVNARPLFQHALSSSCFAISRRNYGHSGDEWRLDARHMHALALLSDVL